MSTLREYVGGFGKRYIWGLSDDTGVSKSKVNRVTSNVIDNRETPDNIDMVGLRRIVLDEPMVRKAIFKKNRDTFKNWFVVKDDEGHIISDSDYEVIRKFDKKTSFPSLLFQSGVCANIYGTGFIEKIYNEQDGTNPMTGINNRKNLIDLELLDSENIGERKKNPDNDRDPILYPVYKDKRGGEEKLIHPSRLEVVRIDKLPYSYFGISIPKVLWRILKSKMNADVGAGELLNWYGRGMYDIGIEGMSEDDEQHTEKQVKKHPDYLIHDEKVSVDVVNPTRIDPQPFYDYFYTNIAAAMEIPKQMLTGEDSGVNAEGISAYYSDIENIQRIIFTPIIESIYSELFRSLGKTWKYYIVWNPIFVDELSEAKILQTRAYSATQAKNSGIIDNGEARDILNNGIVELDLDKIIEDKTPPTSKVSDPNVEPQPSTKPVSTKQHISYTPYLTVAQRDMIEKLRLKGKIEEELQELRLQEAEKNKK